MCRSLSPAPDHRRAARDRCSDQSRRPDADPARLRQHRPGGTSARSPNHAEARPLVGRDLSSLILGSGAERHLIQSSS